MNMQSVEITRALHDLDRDATEALVRRMWDMRLLDATAAINSCCAPGVTFRVLGSASPDGHPTVFEGRETVINAVRGIDVNLAFESFHIVDLLVDGPDVALRWHAVLRNRGTGVVGELSVFDHIQIEAGQIVAYTEFLDTEGFRTLMAGEPQPSLARRANNLRSALSPSTRFPANDSEPSRLISRRATEEVLRAFFALRPLDGQAAIDRYWTPDCELHLIGDPIAIPFARSHVGIDAVKELVRQIDMEFAYLSLDIMNLIVDGDRAAVHWCAAVRHRGTGMRGFIESFDHVFMRGARIHKATEFFDTAQTALWIKG
jgi:ketosteroid isomerase-like protein